MLQLIFMLIEMSFVLDSCNFEQSKCINPALLTFIACHMITLKCLNSIQYEHTGLLSILVIFVIIYATRMHQKP